MMRREPFSTRSPVTVVNGKSYMAANMKRGGESQCAGCVADGPIETKVKESLCNALPCTPRVSFNGAHVIFKEVK